jgi:hypothetical protein
MKMERAGSSQILVLSTKLHIMSQKPIVLIDEGVRTGASGAYVICRDVNEFGTESVSLNYVL